ncbi:MAG: hypothetical protein U5K54_06180 [Cytophagales bacterium]|nr:hypothetical protein [Cytophagales bacterium]
MYEKEKLNNQGLEMTSRDELVRNGQERAGSVISAENTKSSILGVVMDSIRDTLFKFLRIDHLVDNLSGYVEARVELLKIEIREVCSKVLVPGYDDYRYTSHVIIVFTFLPSVGLAHFINSYF